MKYIIYAYNHMQTTSCYQNNLQEFEKQPHKHFIEIFISVTIS